MNLAEESFKKLYPEKDFPYFASINYSGKFRGYNARVQLNKFTRQLTFKLSRNWEGIDRSIQMGLLQSLFIKILKQPAHTTEMDLYDLFLKNLADNLPRTKTHPTLEQSFNRVNEKYFGGLMSMPNFDLKDSLRVLGTYEYGTDTVSITKLLLENPELLDYVMYHELLHKKHKFSSKNGRHRCHTTAFRADEKKFENAALLEKQLNIFVSKTHAKNKVRQFFAFF